MYRRTGTAPAGRTFSATRRIAKRTAVFMFSGVASAAGRRSTPVGKSGTAVGWRTVIVLNIADLM